MLSANSDDANPQAERLERMKSEFLAAQQRRRANLPEAAVRPGDTGDGPIQTRPAGETPAVIADVRQ